MKDALFVLVGITCLAAAPAFAEDNSKIPEPPKSATTSMEAARTYTPRAGLWSLQLDGPAFPMWQSPQPIVNTGYNTVRGIGASFPSSGTVGSGGIGGSLGYTLSDMIEVGGAVGFLAASNFTGFNIEPFLKLNLGAEMMASDSRMNPFALVGVGFNITSISGAPTVTVISPELAFGVEYMLTHSFGVSLYVPVTLGFNTNGGSAVLGLGLGYGLVGYF
jgi:hypothetical protein